MGVIQEKNTLADVICQHKIDGSIIPLKIRILDEDGEYQVYNIRSYKDVSNHKAYTIDFSYILTKIRNYKANLYFYKDFYRFFCLTMLILVLGDNKHFVFRKRI